MHQCRSLLLDLLRQIGMAVTQEVHRNAGCEVQVALALLAVEINSLTPHRTNRRTRIDGHERRNGHLARLLSSGFEVPAPIARGAKKGKAEPAARQLHKTKA